MNVSLAKKKAISSIDLITELEVNSLPEELVGSAQLWGGLVLISTVQTF